MKKIFNAIWKVMVFLGVVGGCITTVVAVWYGWWMEKAFGWKNLKEWLDLSGKYFKENGDTIKEALEEELEEGD